MRNSLKHRPSGETKPTLRERVAALKATAARVMRRQPVSRRFLEARVDDLVLADAVPNLVRLDAEIEASIQRGGGQRPSWSRVHSGACQSRGSA